ITAIDLDHQTWLGGTLPEIAREKAGIIKPGVPVISTPQHPSVAEVLRAAAARQGADVFFVREPLEGCEIGLAGSHQKLNAAVAQSALRAGKIEVSEDAIRSGLKSVTWPGRFQVVNGRTVLDGAHNPA